MKNNNKLLKFCITIFSCLLFASTCNAEIIVSCDRAIAEVPSINRSHEKSAMMAISKVTFDDLWRSPRTLVTEESSRVDMQGVSAEGERNIQVQLNIPRSRGRGTTIAAIVVDPSLENAISTQQKKHVQRKVRGALYKSLELGAICTLSGTP